MITQDLLDPENDWDVFNSILTHKPLNRNSIQLRILKPFRISHLKLIEIDNIMNDQNKDYVVEDLLCFYMNPTDRAIHGLSPLKAADLSILSRALQIAKN